MTQTNSSQPDHPPDAPPESARPRSSSRRRRKRKRREFFGRMGDFIWTVITAPIKLLFLPTSLVEMFYFQGHKTGRRRRVQSVRQRLKHGLRDGLRLPYRLILQGFRRRNLKDLLFLLPALATVGMVCFVGFQLSVQGQRIQDRYNSGARDALLSGNLDLANTYFRRLFDRSSLSAPQSLQWVSVLRAAGEHDQADRLLTRLAPDRGHGYPAAHAMRAIELASSVGGRSTFEDREVDLDVAWIQSSNSNEVEQAIEQLRTHLRSANEEDPRVHLAWAKYWLCQRDIETACLRIERANKSLELSLEAVRLIDRRLDAGHLDYQQHDQLVAVKNKTLTAARKLFESKLESAPLDHHARIQLAATLVSQGNLQQAKDCLRAGIGFQAEPSLRRGLADVFVLEYRSGMSAQTGPESVQKLKNESLLSRVGKLKAAIEADPSYVLPYACLTNLVAADLNADNTFDGKEDSFAKPASFSQKRSFDQADSVQNAEPRLGGDRALSVFRWLVTSDRPSALDHVGLASLYWQRGQRELANWHLDQAWAIEPDIGEQAHQLATAFAFFSDHPDLAWARILADRALLSCPDSSEVLLSHARILLEQGEAELAVQQLNRSLADSRFPEEVHQALEVGYAKLGDLASAYKHAGLAQAARTRRIVAGWKSNAY